MISGRLIRRLTCGNVIRRLTLHSVFLDLVRTICGLLERPYRTPLVPLVAASPKVAGRRVRSRACSIAQRRERALDSAVGDRIIGGEGTGFRHAF